MSNATPTTCEPSPWLLRTATIEELSGYPYRQNPSQELHMLNGTVDSGLGTKGSVSETAKALLVIGYRSKSTGFI
jgi:hypothetical protein